MDSENAIQSSSLRVFFPLPKIHYSLISPKSLFVNQKGSLTPQALQYWARWIRDVFAPILARESYTSLGENNLSNFLLFFAGLRYTTVTVDCLRNSRIHSALAHIVEQNMMWPDWIVHEAQELLQDWEKELGSLRSIRADLWGPGGRLEGVTELEWQDIILWPDLFSGRSSSDGETPARNKSIGSEAAKKGEGSPAPYVFGHNGASVGAWWIHPAAAYRDGVIHGSTNGITADRNGAYAILMTDGEEVKTGRHDVIKYKALQSDPGRFKLMQGVPTRNPVRVLRTWRLKSPWAPKGGLRYDGLYRVVGYSVRLTTDRTRVDSWHYTFELHRHLDQRPFEKLLQHPCADEMDDWNDYQKLKGNSQDEGLMSLLFAAQDRKSSVSLMTESDTETRLSMASENMAISPSIAASENAIDRTLSMDSGYFTRRESEALNRDGDV
ncbi:SRA-YDG [Lasallia pustulata]|uniref:SRA-YDG n=1 Tax=Lasallia pustulata TaxID=136370 RepID=A0A1W5DDW5_9LECA|nr:SRA-YDG [Lasallia pustulata]